MSKLVILRCCRPLLHAAFVLLTFWLGYLIRLQTDLIPGVQIRIPAINADELIIYAILSAALFLFFGIIRDRYPLFVEKKPRPIQFYKIWTYWIVTITFVAYFGGGTIFPGGISRLIILWSALFVLLFIPLLDRIRYLRYNWLHVQTPSKTLFVYKKDTDLNQVLDRCSLSPEHFTSENIQDLDIDKLKAYQTIVLIGTIAKSHIETILDTIRGSRTQFFHIADSFFLNDIVYEATSVHGIVAFGYKASKLDEWASVTKRVFDLVVGGFALILLSPILLLVALAIKIDSRGPILYKQQRVGKGGREFTFIKFRSMYTELCVGDQYGGSKAQSYREKLIDSDANVRKGELQKIENDPRVTRVGKFIRATSLDELPNLFSVIVGTMSLIGPRPHLPREVALYKPRHKRLLSIKPGITGYAQIHGRDSISFDDEARYDLYYIQHRSLWLDINIMFATLKVLSGGRGK